MSHELRPPPATVTVTAATARLLYARLPLGRLRTAVRESHPAAYRELVALAVIAYAGTPAAARFLTTPPPREPEPRSLSTAQAAQRLRITPRAVRLAVERGHLPAIRDGRELRFTAADLETYRTTYSRKAA